MGICKIARSIKKDLKAPLERDPAARSAITVFFTYPGFHARHSSSITSEVVWFRLTMNIELVSLSSS